MKAIIRFQNKVKMSSEGRDLIEKWLKLNPDERIKHHEILKHPFITGREEEESLMKPLKSGSDKALRKKSFQDSSSGMSQEDEKMGSTDNGKRFEKLKEKASPPLEESKSLTSNISEKTSTIQNIEESSNSEEFEFVEDSITEIQPNNKGMATLVRFVGF